jgi:hypothetical protein
MRLRTIGRGFVLCAGVAVATAPGCDDLGVGLGPGEITGLTIRDADGAVLVTVAGSTVSGQVALVRGDSRTLVITLQGPQGPISPGLAETIRVSVTNPGVASWQDAGSGTGTLRGETSGATGMRVDLLRGGSVVYASPSVLVTVT